jgi:hypothetical protein
VTATVATELVVLSGIPALANGGLTHWRATVRDAVRTSRGMAQAQRRLPDAIAAAGGAGALLACGNVYTGALEVTEVAWALGVPSRRVLQGPATQAQGSVVSLTADRVAVGQPSAYRRLPSDPAGDPAWQIDTTCAR